MLILHILVYSWAMISWIEALNMLLYGLPSVFQSFGPRNWVLDGWMLNFMFGGQSGFFRNLTHAQAGTFTLEHEAWVHVLPLERRESRLSVICVYPEVCVFCSPLERGSVSHAQAGVERPSSVNFMHPALFHKFAVRSSGEVHPRMELLYLHVRSSWESHARAWTLSSAKFEKWFSMYSCILILS